MKKQKSEFKKVAFLYRRFRKREKNMEFQITLIPGDGIGPEIVTEARKVLDAVGTKFGHTFSYKEILMGGALLLYC